MDDQNRIHPKMQRCITVDRLAACGPSSPPSLGPLKNPIRFCSASRRPLAKFSSLVTSSRRASRRERAPRGGTLQLAIDLFNFLLRLIGPLVRGGFGLRQVAASPGIGRRRLRRVRRWNRCLCAREVEGQPKHLCGTIAQVV